MIEITNLSFTYPGEREPALRDVSLSLDRGIHAFMGPSGGGKSTLLKVCNGLIPHSTGGTIAGKVSVAGKSTLQYRPRNLAHTVAYLFQDPELQCVAATVGRDVAFGPENLGWPASEVRRNVDRALDLCDIKALTNCRIEHLSGGERQLVALAGLIAMNPRLLCLDEPFAQLDQEHRERMFAIVSEIAQSGTTVLLAEHDDAAVESLYASRHYLTEGCLTSSAVATASSTIQRSGTAGTDSWTLHRASVSINGVNVLHDITMAGRQGQVVSITGANGSGKTTLLRTIAGFAGLSGGSRTVTARRPAYLPQNPAALLWRKTVRDEIAATLRHRQMGDIAATLHGFDLATVAARYPADLSSGQRQRAALATVMAGEPDLILLDEPTRGMDAKAFNLLAAVIRQAANRGACVVLSTHDRRLLDAVSDHEVSLQSGRTIDVDLSGFAQPTEVRAR